MYDRFRVIVEAHQAPTKDRWLIRIGNQSPQGAIVWAAQWPGMVHCQSNVLHDVQGVTDANVSRMIHRSMGVIDPLF